MQLNFVVMPAGCKRASRGFLDSPVKPENDKNVSLLIAVLVSSHMRRKSFISSTVVRHLLFNGVHIFMYHELITMNCSILLCKGFFAHMTAIIMYQMHFPG